MQNANVKIKGITPLLQNNFLQSDFERQWSEKKAVDPNGKEVLHKLYINKEGLICQPSVHIEKAMADAAKKIKVKGNGKATYSKLFGSMVTVSPLLVPHKNQEYQIHSSTIVNPSTKGRSICYRPLIDDWTLEFDIFFEDEIPAVVVEQALTLAGKYNGLGDWRPQKGGKFGKFEVVSFK